MPKAKSPKKQKPRKFGFSTVKAKSIAKGINSMQTRAAFISELIVQHNTGNVDRVVLTMLRLQIRLSKLPSNEKKARYAIVKDFQKRP